MYSLFVKGSESDNRIAPDAGFVNLRKKTMGSIREIKSYYRSSNKHVRNQHILVKLIKSFSELYGSSEEESIRLFSRNAKDVTSILDITSNRHLGKLHDGIFYGEGVSEVILLATNPDELSSNWEDWTPLRVESHPYHDLGMIVPDGSPRGIEGIAVFTLDLTILIKQYLKYRELMKVLDDVPSVHRFIYKYVLVNTIDRSHDLAITNRAISLFHDITPEDSSSSHPISISNLDRSMDAYLLKQVTRNDVIFHRILRSIPSVSYETSMELNKLPFIPPLIRTQWVGVLAKLPLILFLLEKSGKRGVSKQRDLLNDLKRLLRRLDRTESLDTALPPSILYRTMVLIDNIKVKGGLK